MQRPNHAPVAVLRREFDEGPADVLGLARMQQDENQRVYLNWMRRIPRQQGSRCVHCGLPTLGPVCDRC